MQRCEKVLAQLGEPESGDSGSDTGHIYTKTEKLQRNAYIKNVYTTMVIAMYNIAVEYEHLQEFGKAIEYFNRA